MIKNHKTGREWKTYAEYLGSIEWAVVRGRKLSSAKDPSGRVLCSFCSQDTGQMDVHHMHYDTIGNEEDTDLVVLCRCCHKMAHQGIILPTPMMNSVYGRSSFEIRQRIREIGREIGIKDRKPARAKAAKPTLASKYFSKYHSDHSE